jgi:hypothetical protein
MLYTLLALVVIVIALVVLYRALKILWLSSWFLGWLKGMFGLSLLALAGAIGTVAYDLYSYKQVLIGQPIATINFEAIEEQHFDAVVVDAAGKQQRFKLRGDQWQLDARIIEWKGYFASFDIKPAYRLDHLAGRYYDLQKESKAQRADIPLTQSLLKLDLWKFINDHPQWFAVVDTHFGQAKYMPMRAGALYEIVLTKTGVTARPLNDVASQALAELK